ncbi:hypothetical protein NZK35_32120 [Stieleria sp. ICT_E10.1]|uniref:hypothetical protein n=1 Tax=Stieleria sedimenti TaxID=2976331 RepID=UPI00217FDC16|nr:hypothetical protein [Stieleria sedimenti]MCS7471325.1 hypothetical protein [Stieleria sedimenti]
MGARRAGKLADASLVDDSRAVDSRAVDSRAVDSPVGEIQVAFLSLVDRACQVDLDLVVQELVARELVARELVARELVDRACPASEAELADRAYQDGQDSVDFRYLRRARCRDDRVGRALSRVAQAESLRAAAPDEFPVETVAQAESQESFQVE